MTDYNELKRLAEAATPGPWAGEHDVYSEGGQGERICKMATAEDSAFISAANPATVLALIAENKALRKDAERYRWLRKTENWNDAEDQEDMIADICIVESYDKVFNRSGEKLDQAVDHFMAKEVASEG